MNEPNILPGILRAGRKIGGDDLEVIMSRHACQEAADALEAQAKRITELEAQLADAIEAQQVLGLKLEQAEGHSANTVGGPTPGAASACERKAFEQWYATNAFDYEANPIGSRECGLMWKAWQAAQTRTPAPLASRIARAMAE